MELVEVVGLRELEEARAVGCVGREVGEGGEEGTAGDGVEVEVVGQESAEGCFAG